MQLISKEDELRQLLKNKESIGFVPTMGALHEGHLSLIKKAYSENQTVVVSIFVNPIQFNNPEDLTNYPRTLQNDLKLITTISDSIIVFTPSEIDIFEGRDKNKIFDFDGIESQMEGAFRPGHFSGVATIVEILLDIVQPNKAYFGEKDFQQLQIIKALATQLQLQTEIIGCPILREKNGLAMSSRNERLSQVGRNNASVIYQTLLHAKEAFASQDIPEIKHTVTEFFNNLDGFNLEYFEISDEKTLQPHPTKKDNTTYRAFIAVETENIRLIDNVSLI